MRSRRWTISVVVFDGKTIAADRQATNGVYKFETRKIVRLDDGTILAWMDSIDSALALKRWYENGCKPEQWPACQRDKENWARLIVVPHYDRRSTFPLHYYEQEPEPIPLYEKVGAWGSGRDFALDALAMGADAEKAVEVTCRYCITCGMGIDVMEIT